MGGLPPSHTKKAQTAITIPRELYDTVVEFLRDDTRHGYVSAAEFFKDAARRRLEELRLQRRASDLGRRLDDLKPDVDRAATKLRGSGPFCHKCGRQLLPGAAFCSNCGTKAP